VLLYVVDDENWRSKCNVSEAHSNLAIAAALIGPSIPCTVRINRPVVVRHESFFDTGGRYAQFAEMRSPIKFNGLPRQPFHSFDYSAINRSFFKRVAAIQPTYVNNSWMGIMTICIR
jgi:hypothetical protein